MMYDSLYEDLRNCIYSSFTIAEKKGANMKDEIIVGGRTNDEEYYCVCCTCDTDIPVYKHEEFESSPKCRVCGEPLDITLLEDGEKT